MSAEIKGYVMLFIYFFDLFRYDIIVKSFIIDHCRICVTDFREGVLFAPPPSVNSPKKPNPG